MTHFLISLFDPPGIAEADLEAASRDSIAVVRDAQAAGVWVFGGGLLGRDAASTVSIDGTVRDGMLHSSPEILAGFCVVNVDSRDEAIEWARKIAAACRSDQEVREFGPGSE